MGVVPAKSKVIVHGPRRHLAAHVSSLGPRRATWDYVLVFDGHPDGVLHAPRNPPAWAEVARSISANEIKNPLTTAMIVTRNPPARMSLQRREGIPRRFPKDPEVTAHPECGQQRLHVREVSTLFSPRDVNELSQLYVRSLPR